VPTFNGSQAQASSPTGDQLGVAVCVRLAYEAPSCGLKLYLMLSESLNQTLPSSDIPMQEKINNLKKGKGKLNLNISR